MKDMFTRIAVVLITVIVMMIGFVTFDIYRNGAEHTNHPDHPGHNPRNEQMKMLVPSATLIGATERAYIYRLYDAKEGHFLYIYESKNSNTANISAR